MSSHDERSMYGGIISGLRYKTMLLLRSQYSSTSILLRVLVGKVGRGNCRVRPVSDFLGVGTCRG